MNRKTFLAILLAGSALAETPKSDAPKQTIRGTLAQGPKGEPALRTSEGKLILLEGDESTDGVIRDKRLAKAELELVGRFKAPDRFVIDPIHTKAMHVHRDGKKLLVTYWCEVCSIRTYTPGICWCCQADTDLDLREEHELQ